MSTTDCKNLRREIDGASPGRQRSAFAIRHLKACPDCKSFTDQTVKLQEILSSLGTVEAPEDFHFRLRARLAGEKPAGARFSLSGFSFGLRGAALAVLTLMFGSILFFSLKTSPSKHTISANKGTPATVEKPVSVSPSATATAVEASQPSIQGAEDTARRTSTRSHNLVASRSNSRMGSRDMGSRPAPIIRAADLNARASDFPIEASTQPVRMSLDNGRGNSRTISLPPVSYGSQRVMSQGSAPYVATARGSW